VLNKAVAAITLSASRTNLIGRLTFEGC